MNDPTKGIVMQMQDYSIHDGDGVRTIIFLAGCNMRCKWCANPESWTEESKLVYYEHKCRNCGKCAKICRFHLDPRAMKRPNETCDVCKACVERCPNQALAVSCEEKTVDEVLKKIERDAVFFRYTGGGVTFSGGEPFIHDEFLRSLSTKLYHMGISLWAETCGLFDFDKVSDILSLFDHIFIDLKVMDGRLHKQYTGADNEQIKDNFTRIHALGIPLTVRIPLIREVNLCDENLICTAEYMKENLPDADIELLPYHDLGRVKYTALGMKESFMEFSPPDADEMRHARSIFERYGIKVRE